MKRNRVIDTMKKVYPSAAQIIVVVALVGTGYVAYNIGAGTPHGTIAGAPAPAVAESHLGSASKSTTGGSPATQTHMEAPAGEIIYTCSMHPQIRQTEPGDCPICGMDLVPVQQEAAPPPVQQTESAQLLGYACAMNCLPPLEEPGDCPICGMQMQPVYDEAGVDHGPGDASLRRMTMTEEARALLRVQTVPARRRTAVREVRLNGELAVDPGRRVHISTNVGGRVDYLSARFVGARIEKGEDLVSLYSPELLAVQREYLQAVAMLTRLTESLPEKAQGAAQAAVAAARERLRLAGLSETQIDTIAETGEATDNVTLQAPIGGTVVDRPVEEGEYVDSEGRLLTIADLGLLWAEMDAYETDLPWLRVGQPATFTTRSRPGEEFTGTVSYIDPVMQRETRTTRVRVDVENPNNLLMPGMYVTGVIPAELQDEAPLIIPATAPLLTGRRAVVYVEVPDATRPTFEGREVTLGARTSDGFVVKQGLAEGERVVVNGAFQIDSALQIIARPSMMSPQGGVAPPVHDHNGAPDIADPRAEPEQEEGEPQPERLIPTLNSYLVVQTALAKDDLEAAQAGVVFLERAAQTNNRRTLASAASRIANAANIEEARQAFHDVSNIVISLLRHHGNATGADLRLAHCPMAFEGEGADWIQGQSEIFNPYFGASMLRCGTFNEEFPSQ